MKLFTIMKSILSGLMEMDLLSFVRENNKSIYMVLLISSIWYTMVASSYYMIKHQMSPQGKQSHLQGRA